MQELLEAGASHFRAQERVCLEQDQRRHGDFYRSKHELVFVFKVGTAPHINSFGLGEAAAIGPMSGTMPASAASAQPAGRSGNASDGQAVSAGRGRDPRLFKRKDIVLDSFAGSGTT